MCHSDSLTFLCFREGTIIEEEAEGEAEVVTTILLLLVIGQSK